MKRIYLLFLSFIIVFCGQAQLTLTKAANCPVAGTIENLSYFDSTTVVPKATGLNKSWNFMSLVTSSVSNDTYSYVTSASTPSASLFPSANLATYDGAGSYNYYNSQSTYLDLVGDVDVTSGSKSTLSNTSRWMVWPFTYGTTNTDNFAGTAQISTLSINSSGNMNISGTGTGTVTLPGGMKYTNCLQITRTYTYVVGAPFSFTQTATVYEYWSGSFKSPIISVTYSKLDDGSSVGSDFQVTVNASANVGIEEQELDRNSFAVFPNPVKEKLTIVLKDNALAQEIQLFDVVGNLVLSEKNSNTLFTSSLNKGVYIVKVKTANFYSQKQIIVCE